MRYLSEDLRIIAIKILERIILLPGSGNDIFTILNRFCCRHIHFSVFKHLYWIHIDQFLLQLCSITQRAVLEHPAEGLGVVRHIDYSLELFLRWIPGKHLWDLKDAELVTFIHIIAVHNCSEKSRYFKLILFIFVECVISHYQIFVEIIEFVCVIRVSWHDVDVFHFGVTSW